MKNEKKNFNVKIKNKNNLELKGRTEKVFPNCIFVISQIIKDLENEWYIKLKNDKKVFKIVSQIFSLLDYQIFLIKKISDLSLDKYNKADINNIINTSKNKITEKIEQILNINDEKTKNINSPRTLIVNNNNDINISNINYIYTKSNDNNNNFISKFKKYSSLDTHSCSQKSKKLSKTKSNHKSNRNNIITNSLCNSRNNINTNNSNLKNKQSFNYNKKINKSLSSRIYNKTYNNNYKFPKKNSVEENYENPITKIKNIIIKANQDRGIPLFADFKPNNYLNTNSKSVYGSCNCSIGNLTNNSKEYDTIINNNISKSAIKPTFFKSIGFKNYKIENLKNNFMVHKIYNKDKEDKQSKNIIIKVGKKKDRETKQILYDGMKKIQNKLNSKEKFKKLK